LLRLPAKLARVQHLRKSRDESKLPEQTRLVLSIEQLQNPIGIADTRDSQRREKRRSQATPRRVALKLTTTAVGLAVTLEVAARKDPRR
jgi:hypothetical protein